MIENTVGKGEIAESRKISPFPTVFSKDLFYRHVKKQGLFGKGLRLFFNMFCNLLKNTVGKGFFKHCAKSRQYSQYIKAKQCAVACDYVIKKTL